MSEIKFLYIDSDVLFANNVARRLTEAGFSVVYEANGSSGLKKYIESKSNNKSQRFALCILETSLPGKNGLDIARSIRELDDRIPIIFFTSKVNDEDIINGFKCGGDDYLSKTTSMQELLLRINVFLRRSKALSSDNQEIYLLNTALFVYRELRLQYTTGEVEILSQKEAAVLKFLCENANKLLKREEILYNVWGKDDYFMGRSMDVFLTKLRKRIKKIPGVEIRTYHGAGFKFILPG